MKVVILCGGYGTRIRSVADDLPKPMIPVGDLPILWHIMKSYSVAGLNDFVLCLGYKANTIKDFFLSYEAHTRDFTLALDGRSVEFHNQHKEMDWKITFAYTGLEAMTGARVRRISRYVRDDENFMLTYGDGLADINLKELMEFHKSHGKIMTVSGVRPQGRFGELGCDERGLATEFNEKPQASGGVVSGGFFVCRREIFDYLDEREDLVFEKEPMNRLVKDKQMMVYRHEGFWQPMDTFRDYSYLNDLYKQGRAPWAKW